MKVVPRFSRISFARWIYPKVSGCRHVVPPINVVSAFQTGRKSPDIPRIFIRFSHHWIRRWAWNFLIVLISVVAVAATMHCPITSSMPPIWLQRQRRRYRCGRFRSSWTMPITLMPGYWEAFSRVRPSPVASHTGLPQSRKLKHPTGALQAWSPQKARGSPPTSLSTAPGFVLNYCRPCLTIATGITQRPCSITQRLRSRLKGHQSSRSYPKRYLRRCPVAGCGGFPCSTAPAWVMFTARIFSLPRRQSGSCARVPEWGMMRITGTLKCALVG